MYYNTKYSFEVLVLHIVSIRDKVAEFLLLMIFNNYLLLFWHSDKKNIDCDDCDTA